ncbi:MAG TPA: hypothetical protein VFS43_26905 [Polyangiaceae bacterium]|nr:hypothetical protein [Polyangiaceae bacterium]
MKRNRYLEALALAAAAAASFATSAPPPDWTQEDELSDVPVKVVPGETTTLSMFVQMPRETDHDRDVRVLIEAPEGAPVSVAVRPDGASQDCDTIAQPLPEGAYQPPPGTELWHRLFFQCLSEDPDSSAEVRRVLLLTFSTAGKQSLDLRVSVKASASGYDDDPQDPPVLLELR